MMEKRLRALGILGVISLLSYTAMVCLHLHFDTNYDTGSKGSGGSEGVQMHIP